MPTSEDPLEEGWEFWARELRFLDGFARRFRCTRPPEGWTCPRGAGHEGPCAASREEPDPPTVRKFATYMPVTDELLHDSQLRPCDIKDCPHCPQTATKPVSRRTRLRWWCGRKWRHLRLRVALFVGAGLVVDLDEVDDWR